jgi:hypothetical protein
MQTVTASEQGQVLIPIDIRPEDGYGLLDCKEPDERHLADFDVAQAMRDVSPVIIVAD